jgi:hypothetical protein
MNSHVKLAGLIYHKGGESRRLAFELLKYAGGVSKEAFFDSLTKGMNKKESLPFFYYTAWAALYAKGEIEIEPEESTLPSKLRELRKQLRKTDPKADRKILASWENEGSVEWINLVQKMGFTFKGTFEDLGTDLFARYFLTSHLQNKSKPAASRSSAGKTQSELNGGAWYRLNKDPSKFDDIASAIKYLGNYIKRVYDPKSPHFTKREVIPGELKEKRYLVDIESGENPYGANLENIEDTREYATLSDEMEILNGIDPVKAEKQLEDLISRAMEGKVLKENKLYTLTKETVEAKKDLFFLSATVWKMLGEDWAMLVAKRWDEDLARDIMMTCSEVSSMNLAPMMIKRYKFMNISQLKLFAKFVDDCMNEDAVIYSPKVKTEVKKGKSIFGKKMRRKTKSIPQWVNLFLAVNGGFTHQGITIEGDLHSSAKKWGSSLAKVAENALSPREYMAALWNSCKECIPTSTIRVNKTDFVKTMMVYIEAYNQIRIEKQDVREAQELFKNKMKTYFKDSDKKYPYSIIATPMAEGVRMSLILSVLPDEFRGNLTTNNYVVCADVLEKLFNIPQNIINRVRDLSSELVVDDIIDIVEGEVRNSKSIPVSKQ